MSEKQPRDNKDSWLRKDTNGVSYPIARALHVIGMTANQASFLSVLGDH